MSLILLGLFLWTACEFGGFPAEGSKAPLSDNKVLKEGMSGREVCTLEPFVDAPLHQVTIREAIEAHIPVVVMFGTPQHCTQCVEQIHGLTALSVKYSGKVAFVHVDAYRDKQTIKEWVIKGEPWTGLIDRNGVIRHVFHGPTPFPEIEPKIQELMSL
ncbi:MAG: thioredoxin family protein [Nitrospirae bacterium]|nr:thioredoxin family protein [Nitrospirota bacterium]